MLPSTVSPRNSLVPKLNVIALLLLLLFFIAAHTHRAIASCSNARCADGLCRDSAGNNCSWHTRPDGSMTCYSSGCPMDFE